MSQIEIQARIKMRKNTEANWKLESSPPLNGELIIVTNINNNANDIRMKMGDGINNYSSLPFVNFMNYELVSQEEYESIEHNDSIFYFITE